MALVLKNRQVHTRLAYVLRQEFPVREDCQAAGSAPRPCSYRHWNKFIAELNGKNPCRRSQINMNIFLKFKTTINMHKSIVIFLLLIHCGMISGQKVYSVGYPNQADVKVFVVKYENQADLKVFRVKYENQAGENNGKWFFTEYPNQAGKKIYFVEYQNQADLKIYFVKYENQAGWREKNKMHLMY